MTLFNRLLGESKLDETLQQKTKRLLFEISSHLVVTKDNDNVVRFIFEEGGWLAIGPGWLKGIEYVPGNYEKEGIIVQDLANVGKLSPGIYLRPIEARWFVVYQRTD